MKEISYYPGCSLHGTAREYDDSIRGVSNILDIQLHELEDWTCCGASSAHCTDEELAIDLAARNLAIAEKSDRESAGSLCGLLQPIQGSGKRSERTF